MPPMRPISASSLCHSSGSRTRRVAAIALLVTVGALAHQLFALHRVRDAIEHERVPAVGRELGGDGGGVGLALEHQGERSVRRDVGLPEVAEADAADAQPEPPRALGGGQAEVTGPVGEDRHGMRRIAARGAHPGAGHGRSGRVRDAPLERRGGEREPGDQR